MKALVKRDEGPGLWLEDVPVPKIGINDVLIEVLRTGICGTDVHIYNWDAWAQKNDSRAAGGRPRVRRPRSSRSAQRQGLPPGRHRQRRRARRLRPLPQLPGRPAAPLQGHQGRRRQPAGRVRRVPRAADDQRLASRPGISTATCASIFDPFGNAVHTALSFPVLGEDVLITGAGPIGIMAAAVVRHAGARYVVITDVNPYRLELARKMGATLAVDVRKHAHRRRPEAAGHEGRLRRGPGDVGQSGGLPRHARQHVPRRQDRHARHSRPARWPSTGTRSSSTCSRSRASTAARCTRPGTR